ncbi:hypermethylated in cancer 2 protein-like [Xyrichtys novacula]|uniref:Hypermethylated in cancer 2 protein-like n=1 Tax=Xyrichtys novacula TaxID=13765 RepID=A0AAV1G9A1_XYRNO|nr:hypermethylated in cancer 2 protein-like [Xyrichtys novacula]
MDQPNYTQQLLLQLNQQRSKGYLCDVIIVVENALFRAHKNVLAACSSYFKYMVLHENLITLNTEMVNPSVFNQVLDFIYTGQLPSAYVSVKGVSDLLRAASYLQLSDLAALCRRKLKSCESSNHPSSAIFQFKTNGHPPFGKSFQSGSLEDGQSRQNELRTDNLFKDEVFTSPRPELTRQNRTGSISSSLQQSSPHSSISSSSSSDDLPPNSTSAFSNPAIDQWYPTLDWQTRTHFSQEEHEGDQGETIQPDWKTSSEVEDRDKVQDEDSGLKKELQKSDESEGEDVKVRGKKHRSYVYQRQQSWLEPASYQSPYMCIPCGKGFPSSELLTAHVDSHMTEEAEEERVLKTEDQDPERQPSDFTREAPNKNQTSPGYPCSVCGQIFADATLLNQHEKGHRPTRPFSCNVLTVAFEDKRLL